MQLAPIVLFVYNRPDHTRQTIEALLKDPLSNQSNLFIYSDAPKNPQANQAVNEVREYIRSIDGFASLTIIEREKNYGLADSIIDGVSAIINKYEKVIVLEDDLLVSPHFLNYMNKALEYYEDEEKVWNISAWNYPANFNKVEEDLFFWRIPHCWGWGTWKNRWKNYKRDIAWVNQNFTKQDSRAINLGGVADYWNHFIGNKKGKMKTWAIFWYLIAYKHQGLTLVPKISYVRQIGFDGSGTHCSDENPFTTKVINLAPPKHFPTVIGENREALLAIQEFHKKLNRSKFSFKRILGKILKIFTKRKKL